MASFDITSAQNDRIKHLRRLRERRHRDREGLFVVEGPRLVARALAAGIEPVAVFVDGSVANPSSVEEILVEPSVLDSASYRRRSEGLIAIFPQWSRQLSEVRLTEPALVLIAESLEKPGNLGAMLRTCASVGADCLVTLGDHPDEFNPNCVRSSTGALFSVPVVHSSIGDVREWLTDRSMRLIALASSGAKTIWETDLASSCALMVGSEDSGLSSQALEISDEIAAIPMHGDGIDSLNASVALALGAFETVRQRQIS